MIPRKHLRAYIVLAGVLGIYGHAQNILENPSFEEFSKCPQTLGNLQEDLLHWSVPTLGSTDYFNACSQAMGTPKNFNGEQPAEFGMGYVGLYMYAPEDYREYLMGRLLEPLAKGQMYELSFYVSLAERSDVAIRSFGALLCQGSLKVHTRKALSARQRSKFLEGPYTLLEIKVADFFTDKEAWVMLKTEFEARGGERFLILGNFLDNQRTQKVNVRKKAINGAYYYVDMVRLKKRGGNTNGQKDTSVRVPGTTITLDTLTRFKNIDFQFDVFELTDDAKLEIENVFGFLRSNRELQIEIHGHTDALGNSGYNQTLSEKRARAVASYLISLGCDAGRIHIEGFGSAKPLVNATNEEQRARNRRVEFRISSSAKVNNRNNP